MISIRHLTRSAVVALTAAALLITLCPAPVQAQTSVSAGQANTKRAKGSNDPDFVGKWDFNKPGGFGAWKPLQSASPFELQDGVVDVTAKSQRPCLDLAGPYDANDIGLVEIRIRCTAVERATSSDSAAGSMGGANSRIRVLPQLYRGTRLYFTTNKKEKFDATKSIEFPVEYDREFHILTINPHEHPAWKGLIYKIRLDVGDFPNHYQLDYIYFHRKAPSKKTGSGKDETKTMGMAGATTTESKK